MVLIIKMKTEILIQLLFAVATASQNIAYDIPKPVFDNVFSVQVEAIFSSENSAAEATVFFDLDGNRAAINILYQNEFSQQIYRFSKDELITIKDTDCSVNKIDEKSFFPFSVNESKKILKPPEYAFYFTNSSYSAEDLKGFMPMVLYKGIAKVAFLNNAECEVVHQFTKPDFSMPDCDFQHCKSTLVSIMVACEEGNVAQQYNFYHFKNSVDSTVFQIPTGVYCEVESDNDFPDLPNYASFSYDITDVLASVDSFEGTHIQHKSVWYDQELQLVRVNEYGEKGIRTVHIFDFNHGIAFTIVSNIQCTSGPIGKDITMEKITQLPNSIFPEKLRHTTESSVYSGIRNADGLNYEVWTSMSESKDEGIRIVKDLYYIQDVQNTNGFVNKIKTQIAFVQTYAFELDDQQNYKLIRTTYSPINHYITSPRDLFVFGISDCFTKEQKMLFQLEMAGPSLQEGTAEYLALIDNVYSLLLKSANVPLSRIDKFEVVLNENDLIVFQGVIVEISADKSKENKAAPDMNAVYNSIKTQVSSQAFVVNVTLPEEERNFKATYFGVLRRQGDEKSTGYSKSFVGGLGFGMLMMGFVIGIVGLYVYTRLKEQRQSQPYHNMN